MATSATTNPRGGRFLSDMTGSPRRRTTILYASSEKRVLSNGLISEFLWLRWRGPGRYVHVHRQLDVGDGARDVEHALPHAGEGKSDVLGRLPLVEAAPACDPYTGLIRHVCRGELQLEIVVDGLSIVRVHVYPRPVTRVREKRFRPSAVVQAHGVGHRLHSLDVEEDDGLRSKPFARRDGDRVRAVSRATVYAEQVGIADRATLHERGDARRGQWLRLPSPALLPDVHYGESPPHAREQLALADPGGVLVAGRWQVVADPAIWRARRVLPSAHGCLAWKGVRVESEILAGLRLVGERGVLARDGGRDLRDGSGRLHESLARGARLGRRLAAPE